MAGLSKYLNSNDCFMLKNRRAFNLFIDKISYFIENYHFDSHLYWFDPYDEKSKNKFYKAFNSYADSEDEEYPILCYDGTISGSADDGFVATTKKLYIHNYTQDPEVIPYKWNPKLYIKKGFLYSSLYVDDYEICTSNLNDEETKLICDLLNEIIDFFHNTEKNLDHQVKTIKTNGSGEWACSCGTKNIFDFCSECGAKRI